MIVPPMTSPQNAEESPNNDKSDAVIRKVHNAASRSAGWLNAVESDPSSAPKSAMPATIAINAAGNAWITLTNAALNSPNMMYHSMATAGPK